MLGLPLLQLPTLTATPIWLPSTPGTRLKPKRLSTNKVKSMFTLYRVLSGPRLFQALPDQIGHQRRYKTYSTDHELHFGVIWAILTLGEFFGEIRPSTATCRVSDVWLKDPLSSYRLNLRLWFHIWQSFDEIPLFEPSYLKTRRLTFVVNDGPIGGLVWNFNMLLCVLFKLLHIRNSMYGSSKLKETLDYWPLK